MYKEGLFMKIKNISTLLMLLALSISACSSSGNQPGEKSGFSNINDTEKFEIHTAAQKKFLEYKGEGDDYYKNTPTSYYPDGTKHLSDPEAIKLTWDYTIPKGKEIAKYSIVYGQKADLSDGYQVDGNTENSISFYNAYLGKNYYKLIANFTDDTKEETAIRSFEVDGTYPRNLKIAGMTNCRDLGGRLLEDGGKIKQGLVFRTSGKNQNGSLTKATTEEMVNHLKLKNEINLAGDSDSYNLKLAGTTLITVCRMDTSSTGGFHHFSRNTEAVKNFFNFLADSNNYPLYYHCKIGTDRTGVCTVLLTGLLGASVNDIYQDYIFSNFGKIGERRSIGNGDSHDMMKYMNDLLAMPGKTFKNKVYNTLLGIGVSRTTLDTVIANLTEGPTAQGNDAGQVIAHAEDLTATGLEIKSKSSERDNPDKYYVLNSDSQSVSYTFTASKAYTGQVFAYLGNNDASETKKIADAITCQLDNNDLTIRDVTYKDARMGHCTVSGSSRMNYWPVLLGSIDISAGSHTIKISGTSNTMNLGGIYIF